MESLSERELEVARLVVDRKTNPQIAAELFLSSKTVETHLRNAFRKPAHDARRGGASRRARRPRAVGTTTGDYRSCAELGLEETSTDL